MSPERTPVRTVVGLLKDVGRGDLDSARRWVAPEAHDRIGSWNLLLFFPDHSTPPTSEEEQKIDQFIGLFYRITVMEETETEARVHLVFAATDAIIGFPSVAENPLVPNTASFRLALKREASPEESAEKGKWLIASLEPIVEAH
jgi:hypothetical protein